MKFTSTSDARLILRVKNLSLNFKTFRYAPTSMRDLFVHMFTNSAAALKEMEKNVVVAEDLNLELREGERLGILGVNGAGKSSICRAIAGAYKPKGGSIEVFGKVRALFDVGLGVQPELTGRENARLLSAFFFPDDKRRDEILNEALEFTELGEFLDVPCRTYSSGMQTRLWLSLAAAAPCDLVILDEVFEGADKFFREKISNRMLQMLRSSGSVIFISHEAAQIQKVCNRVIVLDAGRILFDGPVNEGLAFYEGLTSRTKRLAG